MLTSKTVQQFLDETASSSPAPGGGSVSALTAALGSALTSMVCRLTIGKKKYAEVQKEMEETLIKSEELRLRCTALIDEDTQAFNDVISAFALPKESEVQKTRRNEAIQGATKTATRVPLKLMRTCSEALESAARAALQGNLNSVSDAGVAALMIQSACEGAFYNVRINLNSIEDKSFSSQTLAQAEEIRKSVAIHARDIISVVESKL